MRKARNNKTTVEANFENEWNNMIFWLNRDDADSDWHSEETRSYKEDFDIHSLLLNIQLFQYKMPGRKSSSREQTFLLLTTSENVFYLIEKNEWNISVEFSSCKKKILSKMGRNERLRPKPKEIMKDDVEPNLTVEILFELFLDEERNNDYDSESDNDKHFAQRIFNGCAVREKCEIVPLEKPLEYRCY